MPLASAVAAARGTAPSSGPASRSGGSPAQTSSAKAEPIRLRLRRAIAVLLCARASIGLPDDRRLSRARLAVERVERGLEVVEHEPDGGIGRRRREQDVAFVAHDEDAPLRGRELDLRESI